MICGFLGNFCYALCESDQPFTCIITKLNLSAGGKAELEATIASAPYKLHYIRKLIVSDPPSGTFLQQMASLVDGISFDVFYEPVLQLLAENSFTSLELDSAHNLHVFVVHGPNDHLEWLSIDRSLLDRIPPTLGQLRRLKHVEIMHSRLQVLSLDALGSNGQLVYVDLSGNHIGKILPMTNSSAETPVKEVHLSGNLLESLDMTVWAPFKALEILNLQNNRLMVLNTPHPVGLGKLVAMHLDSNRLKELDLRHLTLPKLQAITLNDNNFTEIPSTWGTKDALTYVFMDGNFVKTLDFGAFRTLSYLESFTLQTNRVDRVQVSSPPVHLSNLKEIYLHNNTLSRLELNGTDFPELSYVGLTYNKFTAVPQVFKKYPNLHLSLEENPIICSSLMAHRNHLDSHQIVIAYAIGDERCPFAYISYSGFNYCCLA